MTTETENIWTHGTGGAKRPHEWQYLGRVAQEYRCTVCQMRVTKAALKAATDA